ncbi:C6 zinc finger domain protein [Aspergillus sclerotioniger CBS 115572]|uniref:C6 zinc finger domain protein n=1 Tax=Aspergillus sclerotioniger CBS 115572 TaxID=1450535 RepID=A0A317X684_9EURO|nr:C6 zinc finger domain protein [Aspergillus sclerotioniger CBS 115572]PWY94079.1 C6 zinc finger domain protein [Aspergillus sclerotioniger CBS 115572]
MTDFEPRKRRRPAKSCEQCRQRKIRCDRNVPCGPCTRARSSLGCSYRQSFRSPTPDTHQTTLRASRSSHGAVVAPSRPPISEAHGDDLTGSLIDTPFIDSGRGDASNGSSQLSAAIRDLQVRLQHLEERLADTGITQPSAASDSAIEQTLRELCSKVQSLEQRLAICPESTRTLREELSITAMPPRLHTSAKKMKLFGPTHYTHTMDKFQLVGSLEAKGPQPLCPKLRAELTAQTKDMRDLRRSVKMQQTPRLNDPVSDLRDTIPARSVCDELVQCYLRTFEGVYRILHIPSFMKEYQQFWDQPRTTATPFLMKLALVLSIGTTFRSEQGKAGTDYDTRLTQTWIYAAQWWLTGPTEKSTFNLDGLQIFCLLLLARQMGPPGPSPWLSAGTLQIATAMGLHRDSAHFPSLSPFQTEMRTRLWATVFELVLQSSLESASPLSMPFSDTKPPSNLNDADINPDLKQPPISKPNTSQTDTSLQLLLHQSFSLRAEAIQLIHSPNRIPYQQAIDLSTKLRTTCHTITAFFQSFTTTNTTPSPNSLPYPTPFHHKHLLTTLHRYILHLHFPFARESLTTPQYHFSRKLCLESALTIASYNPSTDPSAQLDDFSRLVLTARGSLRGPLNLDIISALALELTTQLEESPPPPSPDPIQTPLATLTTTARIPILQTLQHLQVQSAHVFQALKTPSLKRYIIVSALVSQIKAMEAGNRNTQTVVYDTVRECLGVCQGALREMLSSSPSSFPASSSAGIMMTPADSGASGAGIDAMGVEVDLGLGTGVDLTVSNMPLIFIILFAVFRFPLLVWGFEYLLWKSGLIYLT